MQFGDVPEVLPTKQPFWDRPGVLVDKALVEGTPNSTHSRTSFFAACCQHSGDWLFALPTASFGLKMDDEALGGSESCCWLEARVGSVRSA